MANNLVVDLGIDVGKDRTENSWFKLKMGKGTQEVQTLKSEVETSTGVTLDDSKHFVSFWFPADADLEVLHETVSGLLPGEDAIKTVEAKDGKWLMVSLTEAAGTGDEANMLKGIEEQLTAFFGQVESNAYLEVGMRTPMTWGYCKEVAESQNENKPAPEPVSNIPSFMNFMENMSYNFRCDMDHDFAISVMKFASTLGAPVNPEFLDFVKKFNKFTMNLRLAGIRALDFTTEEKMQKMAWGAFNDNIGMIAELAAFKSLTNQMRMVFILKDNSYCHLDMNMIGMSDYINYFSE
jgi:hypothetical protein